MCVKYYELRCMFQKIAPRQIWRICACLSVKIRVFSVSTLKDQKLVRKQACTKTEAYKLYSRLFWICLPNIIKIDRYNFELYRFKVDAFFWDTVYCIFTFKARKTRPSPITYLTYVSLPYRSLGESSKIHHTVSLVQGKSVTTLWTNTQGIIISRHQRRGRVD